MIYILAFFNVINTFVIFDYMDRMYKRSYESKQLYFGAFVIFWSIHLMINLLHHALINAAYAVISIQILGVLLYQKSSRKTIYNFLFVLYLILTDILSFAIFAVVLEKSIAEMIPEEVHMFAVCLLNYTIVLGTYRYLIQHFFQKTMNGIFMKKNIFFLALIFFEIFIIVYFWRLETESAGILLFIIAAGFILLDFYLVGLLEFAFSHGRLKQEISFAQQQVNLLDSNLSDIRAKYDGTRKLVHDARAHLVTLESLHQAGETELLERYRKQIGINIDKLGSYVNTGNRFTDILFNGRKSMAEAKEIKTDFLIEKINWSSFTEFELNTLLGNLLNNAIEACERMIDGEKYIELCVFKSNKNIIINIKNSCNPACLNMEGKRYLSSKSEHEGLGLQNVQDVVENHQGNLLIDARENEFEVGICLVSMADDPCDND